MALKTIPETALACGRSAREVRLLIEQGELPAVRPLNHWLIDSDDLERLRPLRVPERAGTGADERVRALTEELESTRAKLEDARAKIHELESSGFGQALKGSSERGALTPLFRPS